MFSSLIPKLADFTDDQIAEAASKFLKRDLPAMQALVASPHGQLVIAQLRGLAQEGEAPEIFHRCPNCGFAHTIELK